MIPSWMTVGMIVEYELAGEPDKERFSSKSHPRWDHRTDHGPSGKWFKGRILEIHRERQVVVTTAPEGVMGYTSTEETWSWPIEGHDHYQPSLYNEPGYLRPFILETRDDLDNRFTAIAEEL